MEYRQEKEKEFHNKAFGESTRHRLSKAYTIGELSFRYYREYLFARCTNKKLLELGCGLGYYALYFAQRSDYVLGIDLSDVAIAKAVKRAQSQKRLNIAFSEMNAEALACKNGCFDLVCGMGLLHHLDLDGISIELKRILKPAGEAVFIEPLGHNPVINLFRKLTPLLRTEDEHPLRLADITRLKLYFPKVEVFYFHLLTLFLIPVNRLPGFQWVLELAAKADRWLFRVFPLLRKYAWMILIILPES